MFKSTQLFGYFPVESSSAINDSKLGFGCNFQSRSGVLKFCAFYLSRETLILLNCIVQPPHLFEGCEAKPVAETIAWPSLLSHPGFYPWILWNTNLWQCCPTKAQYPQRLFTMGHLISGIGEMYTWFTTTQRCKAKRNLRQLLEQLRLDLNHINKNYVRIIPQVSFGRFDHTLLANSLPICLPTSTSFLVGAKLLESACYIFYIVLHIILQIFSIFLEDLRSRPMVDSSPVSQQPKISVVSFSVKIKLQPGSQPCRKWLYRVTWIKTCRKEQCREQQQVEEGQNQATVGKGATQALENILT